MNWRGAARCGAIISLALPALSSVRALGQTASSLPPQRIDVEYTRIIRQNLDDPRMTTELVDHLPASDAVPTPLAFLGPRRRHARRADVRERYRPLLPRAGRCVATRQDLHDRHIGGRPRHRDAGDRGRGDDRVARHLSRSARALTDPQAHD